MKPKWRLIAAFLALFAGSAAAWDDGGHLLIGEIAARRLRPQVVREMKPLIALLDPQFNQGQPYNLITAGVWLDDQRWLGKENPWRLLHYIDFECSEGANPAPPEPPHALSALDEAVATLRDRQAMPEARAVALAQVIHIVGDIHQPLHAADRKDRGGNEVKIAPLLADGNGPANLHAFWDNAYRLDAKEGAVVELWGRLPRQAWPGGPNEPGLVARQATAFFQAQPVAASAAGPGKRPWVAWARETYAVALQSGWPKEAASANGAPVTLSPAFVHQAHCIAEAQMVKAGVRLGELLNELLCDGAKEPPR